MSENINLIILLLKQIESDDNMKIHRGFYNNTQPLVNSIIYLANKYLITEDGHPNRENMEKITKLGFSIKPGETDSFGWLTGCIHLKYGIIVFG